MPAKSIARLTLAAALAGGAAWWAWPEAAQPVTTTPTAARSAGSLISFAIGSPQLDYIRTSPVHFVPEPAVEPLPARLAMDEDHTSRLFTPVNGRILRVLVETGDSVTRGQPLAEIDAPDYAAAVADQRKAQADHDRARRDYERQRDLERAGVIARKDLEVADTLQRDAFAELDRANARLRILGNASGNGTLVLRAPVTGTVAMRQANPGTEVRTDADSPLFVITDSRTLWLQMDVPEAAARHLKAGQQVTITSDSDASFTRQGVIAKLPPALDPDTHRLKVRAIVDNQDGSLRAETFVRAMPVADSGRQVARVPNAALVTTGYYTYVFVEKREGTYERRKVNVVLTGHGEAFVDQGLAPGEKVVVTGALLLDSEMRSGA